MSKSRSITKKHRLRASVQTLALSFSTPFLETITDNIIYIIQNSSSETARDAVKEYLQSELQEMSDGEMERTPQA